MIRSPSLAGVLLLCAFDAGCEARSGGAPPLVEAGAPAADLGGGRCDLVVATPAGEGAGHVAACSAVSYRTKPPASGSHYPSWPVFRVYDRPVPWGFLVHALEHGAVVIVHNCGNGCAQDLADAKALVASVRPRPGCPRPPVILAPDPTLDVPWAAAGWGRTMRGQCFDRDGFASFIEQTRDRGPEFFPDDCGALDGEAAGWCPPGEP